MGTRNYYAIYSANASFDDHEINPNLFYITQNKKDAIKRFRWLYDKFIRSDFTNDEGEVYAENDIEIRENKDEVSGYFFFMEDYYGVEYHIKTIKTNAFSSWSTSDNQDRWEVNYQRFLEEEKNASR